MARWCERLMGGKWSLVEVDVGGVGRMRSGKSPPKSSASLRNLLKMVVDESVEESTPNKASAFRGDGELCFGASSVLQSIHLLYTQTRDDSCDYIEYHCYDCWASKDVDFLPEGFLQAHESTSKWRYTMLRGCELLRQGPWGFLA